VLTDGVYITLDAPGADGVTVGQGINNPGTVAGYYTDGDANDHGFLLTSAGYTSIDVLGAA
jgi:hypothetical protein